MEKKDEEPSSASRDHDGDSDRLPPPPMISLEELARKMYNPCELSNQTTEEEEEDFWLSLSHVPWRIQQQSAADGTTITANNTTLPSYLDLRRQQNVNWATSQLEKGKEVFYSDPRKAQQFFEEGLDLVPDHIGLLLEFGKLLAHSNLFALGLAKIRQALEIDPDHTAAKELYERIRKRQALQNQQPVVKDDAPVPRNSSAYQDALFERSLLQADDNDDDDDLMDDESEIQSSISLAKKRNKKKHRKRKKKRRKRSRSDDSSEMSDASDHERSSRRDRKKLAEIDDSFSESTRSRSRSRKSRKKKRKRKCRGRSRSPSPSGSTSDEENQNREGGAPQGADKPKSDEEMIIEQSSSDTDSRSRKRKKKHRKRRKKRSKGSE